jgi:hypothetical protein
MGNASGGNTGSASPFGYGMSGSFGSYLSGYGLRVPSIAGITQPLLTPTSWLDFIAEDYGFNVGRWVYAREHYTGEVAAPWRISAYLIRKKIGETIEAFEERVLLADYTPYFGAVVDTLAGMLVAREDETDRTWGKNAKGRSTKKMGPLGQIHDQSTILGRLWVDADGQHNSWTSLWQMLATELVAVHTSWIFVDGGANGLDPKIKLVQAEAVSNWLYDPDGKTLIQALMKIHIDVRTSVKENPRTGWETQWVLFTVDGWQRWHKVRKEVAGQGASNDQTVVEVPEMIDEGTWHYETRAGDRTIPLLRVSLPLKRNVGYLLARKCNAIFNKESERDHLLRFATFPLLNIVAEDTMFKRIEDRLRLGSRVLQAKPTGGASGAHHFIAPPAEPAKTMADAIKEKVEAFYAVAFREFASAVSNFNRDRVTATEVLTQREVGLEAFLAVVSTAVDNAENQTLWFLEQTVFPKDKSKWGQARVERPKNFGPINPAQAIEALKARYVGGGPLPAGRAAQISAIKRIAEFDGIEFDENEISEALDSAQLAQFAATVQLIWPDAPDELKAEIIAQWGESAGYGTKDDLKTKALAQLEKNAKANAQKPSKPAGGNANGPPKNDADPTRVDTAGMNA